MTANRSTYDTRYKTLIKLGRSIVWTSIPLYALQYPMHRMLVFYNTAQNQKGMKIILNISSALLKIRDHAEPLTLHSLFHSSSQRKHRCQSGYYKCNKFLCRIETGIMHSSTSMFSFQGTKMYLPNPQPL